jgi:hypothetical protein
MSTEQSLDPQLIEETKQQIRSLVGEIAQLTKQDSSPQEFYGQFLTRVVQALAAVGGAVWTINEERRLALQFQINLQQTNLRDDEQGQAQHARLLYKALSVDEGMLVAPHSGAGEEGEDQIANPTDFLLVLGPLKTDLEVAGVLEIFQRPDTGPNTQKGYLRFVLQMCELAGDFLKSHQLRHFSDRQILWTQLEEFTHVVYASLDPRETAYTIANEGRRLIECDRVSVAIRKGNKCVIEAVSGQDLFDKRSNTVRLLGRLATAVVATGDPVWYTGDTRDMAPQVEDAVQEYVDESHSKNVAVLPLKRAQPAEEDDPHKRPEPEPPVGALIVEQIEDSRVPQSMVQRVEVVSRHSSTAMANAMEHQNLFLMPLWRLLGKTRWVLRARTLPKTMTIAGAVLALLLVLIFWPADFEVDSKGTAEPIQKRDVFNQMADARVDYVPDGIRHGANVARDQLLIRLRSDSMQEAKDRLLGEKAAVDSEIAEIERERTTVRLTPVQENERLRKLTVLRVNRQTLERLWEKHEQKEKELLEIRSPIDGEIVTWDPEVLLGENRPLERGHKVMEIANLEGTWRLELKMPEDRMGHVVKAEKESFQGLRKQLRELWLEEEKVAWRQKSPAEKEIQAGSSAVSGGEAPEARKTDPQAQKQIQQNVDQRLAAITSDEDLRQQFRQAWGRQWLGKLRALVDSLPSEVPDMLETSLSKKKAAEPKTKVPPAPKKAATSGKAPSGAVQTTAKKPPPGPSDDQLVERLQKAVREAKSDADSRKRLKKVVDALPGEHPRRGLVEELLRRETAWRDALSRAGDAASYVDARAEVSRLMTAGELPRGALRSGLQGLLARHPQDHLSVSYQMATHPGVTYYGTVEEIEQNAEVRGDEGNTVLIKVAIDKDELPGSLRPGAEVTANVACGRRSLGYVIFHDLIAFIQNVWFRWF